MNHLSPIVATVVDEPPGDSLGRKESKRPFRLTVRGPRSSLCVACVVLGFVVSLAAILCWAYDQWRVGAFHQRTFAGPQFALRITAFPTRRADGRPRWLLSIRSQNGVGLAVAEDCDVPLWASAPIPSDQFRRLTDSCAYFFHRTFSASPRTEARPGPSKANLAIRWFSAAHLTTTTTSKLWRSIRRRWHDAAIQH